MKRASKKNKRTPDIITTALFLLMVFMPGAIWIFAHDYIGEDTSENRTLVDMPDFSFNEIETFPGKFDKFYNDHVPFRKNIREAWAIVNWFTFRDATNKNVIVGKESLSDGASSWIFYSDPVLDTQGIRQYSDGDMDKIAKMVQRDEEFVENGGAKMYYFVVPNKENIYRDKIPDGIEVYNKKSRLENALDYLDKKNIGNVIYLKDVLSSGRKNAQVYYKQDSHWNALGAFLGVKELVQVIAPEYSNFEYEIGWAKESSDSLDMVKFIGVYGYFNDDVPYISYLEEERPDIREEKAKSVTWFTKNESAPIKKKLLLIGDSYRLYMRPWLAKLFEETVIVHWEDFHTEMFNDFQPDIVTFEIVERDSDLMRDFWVGER